MNYQNNNNNNEDDGDDDDDDQVKQSSTNAWHGKAENCNNQQHNLAYFALGTLGFLSKNHYVTQETLEIHDVMRSTIVATLLGGEGRNRAKTLSIVKIYESQYYNNLRNT